MTNIKAIFFDVGQTLLTPALSESLVFSEEAARQGVKIDPEEVEPQIPLMYKLYEDLYEQDDSFWSDEVRAVATWLAMYDFLCSLLGIEASKRAPISRGVHQRYFAPESWKTFDEVRPVLTRLQEQGYRMGLISNWDGTLQAVIDGLGLAGYFEVVLASAVEGLHKPMPEIFHRALEKMGVKPSEALHVGDHAVADVEGARAVGITPVYLVRHGDLRFLTTQHPEPEDTFIISSLVELLAILGSPSSPWSKV